MEHIFDSHAHYDDSAFDSDRQELLASLPSLGVCGVVNCGTDLKTSLISLELADKFPYLYAACGIHPENIGDSWEYELEEIKKLLIGEKCVAVGEIGLDYHWDTVPRELQKTVFEKQLQIADTVKLPVIIHDREAHGDTLELLKKHKTMGVMHCFSGSVETAKEILSLGMYIGIGGALTFKNAIKPVEVVKMVPQDRLLVETDCPYMSPVPFRGKRNDSSKIKFVIEKIAEIRNENPQDVADYTSENAKKLFLRRK